MLRISARALINFWSSKVGAYSRVAVIRSITVSGVSTYFMTPTVAKDCKSTEKSDFDDMNK